MLTLRRTLMNLAQQECDLDFDREIGQSWLSSAKTAQKYVVFSGVELLLKY